MDSKFVLEYTSRTRTKDKDIKTGKTRKAKDKSTDLTPKAKDSKFVVNDTSGSPTKAKDNKTGKTSRPRVRSRT